MDTNDQTEDGDPTLARTLDGLLDKLGVATADTRDTIEQTVDEALASLGHQQARMFELRYGTLVLKASPPEAALLRFSTDQLLTILTDKAPDAGIRQIRVFPSTDPSEWS